MRVYDLVMTHKLDADDFFIHRVQQHCAERGLNFFLIEPLWVESFRIYFELKEVWARVLLNMNSEHHDQDEVYHRLVRLAHEKHTQVIDPPDVAMAAFNKARLHPRLEAAGVKVPYTVVVPQEEVPTFKLTEEQRAALGTPFVIKPSMGYGRRGLVMDAATERDLARSLLACPDPHYLMQKRIVPRVSMGEPAWFRAFHVFGSLWFCWWNCYTDQYRQVTTPEMEEFALEPLREIICRIAQLTGMKFFSTEIAQNESGDFVAIDYVNDQCHLLTQSTHPNIGVPDELVAAIARRLVDGAQQLIAQNSGKEMEH